MAHQVGGSIQFQQNMGSIYNSNLPRTTQNFQSHQQVAGQFGMTSSAMDRGQHGVQLPVMSHTQRLNSANPGYRPKQKKQPNIRLGSGAGPTSNMFSVKNGKLMLTKVWPAS